MFDCFDLVAPLLCVVGTVKGGYGIDCVVTLCLCHLLSRWVDNVCDDLSLLSLSLLLRRWDGEGKAMEGRERSGDFKYCVWWHSVVTGNEEGA